MTEGIVYFEIEPPGIVTFLVLEGDAISLLTTYTACDHSDCKHNLIMGFLKFCLDSNEILVIERVDEKKAEERAKELQFGLYSFLKHTCKKLKDPSHETNSQH